MSLFRQLTKNATAAAAAVAVLAACGAQPASSPPAAKPAASRVEVVDSWSADEQPAFAQHATSRWRVRARGALGNTAEILRADGTSVLKHTSSDPNRTIEDVFLIGDIALVIESTRMEVIQSGGRFAPKRVVRYRLPDPRPVLLGAQIPLPSPSSPWAAGPTHAAYLHENPRGRLCVVTLNAALTARQVGCAPPDWGIQALQVGEKSVTWQQGSETCAQAWGAPLAGGLPRRFGAPNGSGCAEWEAVEAAGGSVWSEVDRRNVEQAVLYARRDGDRRPAALGRAFTGTLVTCGGWTWWRAATSYAPEVSLQVRRWKPGGGVQTYYTAPKPDGIVMSRPECAGDTLTFEVGDTATNRFQLHRVRL